mmetsp:Transcript_102456/g.181987  ORF Transcript_102456/g.181987 Transcript_102456/m.181987 type:complete len:145 (-) Transcript_102456:62-496(-)
MTVLERDAMLSAKQSLPFVVGWQQLLQCFCRGSRQSPVSLLLKRAQATRVMTAAREAIRVTPCFVRESWTHVRSTIARVTTRPQAVAFMACIPWLMYSSFSFICNKGSLGGFLCNSWSLPTRRVGEQAPEQITIFCVNCGVRRC